MSGIVAVVPVRDGANGKTRLANSFSALERTWLIAAMARYVIGALSSSHVIDTILVVTRDPDFVRPIAVGCDRVRIMREPHPASGLNGALEAGRDWAVAHGATGVLIVPADLPLLRADDVRRLVAADEHETPVVIAPDRRRNGTNALLLPVRGNSNRDGSDRCHFVLQFGQNSYTAHLAEAARCGLAVETMMMEGTELDLDTIDDWQSLSPALQSHLREIPCALDEPGLQPEPGSCPAESTTRIASAAWS